ncbi:MAG: thioredoxin-like domain-containing protein [Fimbriimonadales bacterium]|nr:thioredoxin-like domain-containing protein [Fimbriimonadales bacterium]
MKTGVAILVLLSIAILALWQLFWRSHPRLPSEGQRMEGTLNAPDFPEGLQWLNTDRPLSLRELRGKVVLLDFWTYCCINCMHILPDLKKLERKYADALVVIGVHSAKFFTEQQTENIRQAILRYDIEHPVVNDHQMIMWQQYGVRAWPTLVLIAPSGKIVGYHAGEGVYEIFDRAIAETIKTAEAKGTLTRGALNLRMEREREARTVLRFPGKVLADERTNRLFIADSNHHRVLVVSLKDNRVEMVIGSGAPGFADGAFDQARFNNPQGMAYDPDTDALYIADTDNHAIRKANLRTRMVETLAGTGEQSRAYPPRPGKGRETALNSPWDVVLVGDTLYIAMAGSHQLWRLNLKTLQAEPHAGTGREACLDGSLRSCALAQPSGITTDGKKLYFADSEVSCIRAADIDPNGTLETLVGGDLFEFGDIDGFGRMARLQHPLGVVYVDGMLYVADTYNNKIKRVDPRTHKIETFLGTGAAGARDGDAPTFDEPGGISYAHGKLYIADTNNHLIRVADLKTKRVETLKLRGLEAAKPPALYAEPPRQMLETVAVNTPTPTLTLQLRLPQGHKLNPNARSQLRLTAEGATAKDKAELTLPIASLETTLPLQLTGDRATLNLHLLVYHCRDESEGLCYLYEQYITVPVQRGEGTDTVRVVVPVAL